MIIIELRAKFEMILLICTSCTYYYFKHPLYPHTMQKVDLNASIVGNWMECLDSIGRSFDKSSFTRHGRKSLKMHSRCRLTNVKYEEEILPVAFAALRFSAFSLTRFK